MDIVRDPPDERRCADRRNDRERGRHRALPDRSAIELALELPDIAGERALGRSAPSERMPLLEAKRRQNREQVHEVIPKAAVRPDCFVVSTLGPRRTSIYCLGPCCGPSRTQGCSRRF